MVNIVIVDAHPIVRKGLECYLNSQEEFNIVDSLDNALQIFDVLSRKHVDIIISEIDLPVLNGITAIKAIKKKYKAIKVLVFSSKPEEIYALNSLKAGASGYLSKSTTIETIVSAIKGIKDGNICLSEKMENDLLYNDSLKSRSLLSKTLSTRETEVLKLLTEGKKNKDIAKELNINEKTVSTYKTRLYKKLNVNNIVDLLLQA